MAKRTEVRCQCPKHRRLPGQPCRRHLFNISEANNIVTISKKCPDCNAYNYITITGRVRPQSAESALLEEAAHGPTEQARFTPRQD